MIHQLIAIFIFLLIAIPIATIVIPILLLIMVAHPILFLLIPGGGLAIAGISDAMDNRRS